MAPVTDTNHTRHADISWDSNGQPISSHYDDIYFSKAGGLDETRHVFLAQNKLPQRFANLSNHQRFVIGETGFGSGLNFLATCQLWKQTQESTQSNTTLHYLAVEKHPLTLGDLQRALSLWPELDEWSEQLLRYYSGVHLPGFQFFELRDGIRLTLIIDEAVSGLRQLLRSEHPAFCDTHFGGIDAWFLDGFAPTKNPDMWRPELFKTLADLSHSGTTLGTFTTAGIVKKGLAEAGFNITKNPGFGRKREQLSATFSPSEKPPLNEYPCNSRSSVYPVPWSVDHVNTAPSSTTIGKEPADVVVIGAGLAGCHSAAALAKQGLKVAVFDRAPRSAQGASGNPQGIVYGKLSKDDDGLAQFNLAALLFAQQAYAPYFNDSNLGEACGVLQLASSAGALKQLNLLREKFAATENFLRFVNSVEMQALAGIDCGQNDTRNQSDPMGVFFPHLGWLSPQHVCRALITHPNIDFYGGSHLTLLEFDNSSRQWLLTFDVDPTSATGSTAPANTITSTTTTTTTKKIRAPRVVIATANDCRQLPITQSMPCKPIRGQVSFAKQAIAPDLKTVICGDGYIAPPNVQGTQTFGATFSQSDLSLQTTQADHCENLSQLKNAANGFAHIEVDPTHLDGRAGLRCTTPDYLPIVGPVPDEEAFCQQFALLRKNANSNIPRAGEYHPGLYINVGHGSRGLAYTPLSAALLAAHICRTPFPIPRDLVTALHPARFLVRDLTRKKR